MKHAFSKMITLGIIAAWQLSAGTIVQEVNGTSIGTEYFGEVLQTPAGGPWNTLTFNFYSDDEAEDPTAAGTLFLLSVPYVGLPSALSSSTTGFIASTSTMVGGVWDFATSVQVAPGTQYYVYENALMSVSGGALSSSFYYADSVDPLNFTLISGTDLNYRFAGNVVTGNTPEPSTLLLMAPALLLVLRRRLTR